MQFYSSTDMVDVDLYRERLNLYGQIYIDANELGLYSMQQQWKSVTLNRLCLKYMTLHSMSGYNSVSSDSVLDYLQKVERIPKEKFRKKNVISYSLDTDKILYPIQQNGGAVDFLDLYIKRQQTSKRASNMSRLFERISTEEQTKGWGEVLTALPFTAKQDVNLRFYYSDENLISIPTELSYTIKARKGYVLAWGDFAQSDPRIAYNLLLRDETNIKYIEAFPSDIYAGFANWVREFQLIKLKEKLKAAKESRDNYLEESYSDGTDTNVSIYEKQIKEWKPFTGFKDKKERDLYKVYILETIYGTRNHKIVEAAKFISTLGQVLDSCPRYKKFWDDVKHRASFGFPLRVKCYMGHTEMVPCFDGSSINETLFKCLNYPVQGGTSEIMILTVNRILDKFYSLGYTQDDVHVYYIRHDEPIFEIKESVMKDSWVFADFEDIQVDDWTPLNLDFEFGISYTKPEDEFMSRYQLSKKVNRDKIQHFNPVAPPKKYYPLDDLLEIAVDVKLDNNNIAIVSILNVNDGSVAVKSIQVPTGISPTTIVRQLVTKYSDNLYKEGYQTVVVYNSELYHDDIGGDVPIVKLYRPSSNVYMFRANLCSLSALSKRDNTQDDIVNSNREYLSSLKKCRLFEVAK